MAKMIVIFLASLAYPVCGYCLAQLFPCHRQKTMLGMLTGALLVILYVTLISRNPGTERQMNLEPFWSYCQFYRTDVRWQIYLNIILFIPFGALLASFSNSNMIKVLFVGFLLSTSIEITQYYACLGLCEFDDVLNNTIGTAAGYSFWQIMCQHVQIKIRESRNGI